MIRQQLSIILVIYAFLSGLLFTSCTPDKKESISTGEITLDSAIALAKHVEYTVPGDSCISLYLNAMILAKKEENFGRQIYLHDILAENYIYFYQYNLGKQHLDSAFEIAEVHDTHYEWIGMCYASLGNYYARIRDFEKSRQLLQKTLNYRIENLGENHEDISNSYFELGYYYLTTRREFDKSIEYNEKALELRIKNYGKESSQAAECYNNLAYAYKELGDNKKAIKFQKKSVEVMEKTFAKNSAGIINGYFLLGQYNSLIEDYKNAIQCYQKVFNADQNQENQYIKMNAISNMADAYLESNLNRSKTLYDSSLKLLSKKFGENNPVTIPTHQKLSSYYRIVANYDSAVYHLKLASNLITLSSGVNSINYANVAIDFAELLLENRQSRKAIEKADEAVNAITSFQYAAGDKKGLISSDEKLNRMDLATAFFLKAKALNQINTISSLKSSFSYLLQAIEIIENIKRKYSSNESRSYLSNQTEIVFDNAIQVALKLVNLTGELYYKEYAFTIAEKSRAFNLLAEINNANAKKFSGIPPEISDKEEKLKRDITFYSELAYKYSTKKIVDTTGLKKIKSTLFEKERQYDVFIKNLEINFPKYHQIKNQATNITVKNVQATLSKNEALIEYFIGESHLTTFVITQNDFKIINQLKNKKLELTITELYNAINKFEKDKAVKLSKEIYQLIVAKPVQYLGKQFNTFKIVPHKELAYLPFDCLINEQKQYLIEDYITSYYYSASLLKADVAKSTDRSKNILLLAPVYDNEANINLPPLQKSESEAKAINALFQAKGNQTKIALRKEASKSNFESSIKEFNIIHLATHTMINREDINFSEIKFWVDKNKNSENTLTLSETFNLDLNTELLTLSSCESGIGELIKGEGMMSFTRGFSYSGAQNIVCSLWKVNDLFTSETMINMYKHINEGMAYEESLRLAKLELIKTNPDLSPKDWAGFILISNK